MFVVLSESQAALFCGFPEPSGCERLKKTNNFRRHWRRHEKVNELGRQSSGREVGNESGAGLSTHKFDQL